jgi:hypothetical protein
MGWRKLTSGLPFRRGGSKLAAVKAAKIIAEIKSLPPEGLAEVSAFILRAERKDPALHTALQRKRKSIRGQVVSRPYEQVRASVRASLHPARCG